MATVQPITKGVVKPVVGKVVLPFAGSNYLQFNGTDQYAEHAAWTPTGVNFSISLRYTPASADIGSLVTILGDGILQKDASNNLVFNYTDTAAGAQAVTLSALALVADTEYLITVSSDGNGVSVAVGADTALNAAVIDPSTLEIESWMASNGATLSAGIIRDIDFQDHSAIQNGTFLEGDASAVYVDVGVHTIENDSTIDIWLRKWTAFTDNRIVLGGDHLSTYYLNIANNGNNLSFWINGQSINFSMAALGATAFQEGQDYHISFLLKDNTLTLTRDGDLIAALPFTTLHTAPFPLYLFRSATFALYADWSMQFKLTHNTSGDTWEYLLNNITSEGIAPNTGNTVDSTDLWSPASIDPQWTDNGDGSYTINGDGSYQQINHLIPDTSKRYRLVFEVEVISGNGISLQQTVVPQIDYGVSGTHEVMLGDDAVNFQIKRFSGPTVATITIIGLYETYDGIVNNYDPVTDLVTIPNNTRRYLDPAIDSNIQADELNIDPVDGPELWDGSFEAGYINTSSSDAALISHGTARTTQWIPITSNIIKIRKSPDSPRGRCQWSSDGGTTANWITESFIDDADHHLKIFELPDNATHVRVYYTFSGAGSPSVSVKETSGKELFVPTLLQAGWTDNGDGSYSWDTSAVTYIDVGLILEIGKFYRLKATATAITGIAHTGFSGSGFSTDYERRSVVGSGDIDCVLQATGTYLRFYVNEVPSTGIASNISVKETTSAEIINFDQSMVQS